MKRPQLVSQGTLARVLQAAEQAWDNRNFPQAIEQLERAVTLSPANCDVLLQLGRVYGLRYDYAAAERCFERAIRFARQKTQTTVAAACRSVDFADHQLAERYFRLAVEQKDVSAEALARMADLYERLHRTDEARALIERALQQDPACASALLARARLDRQGGRMDDAAKSLQPLFTIENRDIRVRAFYELGMI